jgi:transketolase
MTISQRDIFGQALANAGEVIPNLFVLDADNATATRVTEFATRFPERYINVGVAEQNLVGIAAGLTLCGYKVLACTFAIFLCGRAFETIRNCIALNNLPVALVGTHAGVSVGKDGSSHFAIEDIALMRSLPNMQVVVPADARQISELLPQVLVQESPTYFRISRSGTAEVTPSLMAVEFGKGMLLADGENCCIVASGLLVHAALLARESLARTGIQCAVAAIHTVKPLDRIFVLGLAKQYHRLVVVEEHNIHGGLYGAVAELLCAEAPVHCTPVCLFNTFAECGSSESIFEKYRLTPEAIEGAVRRNIEDC